MDELNVSAPPVHGQASCPLRMALARWPDVVEGDMSLAAAQDLPALILGGSIKRRMLCARQIHASSAHAAAPFITCNLAATLADPAVTVPRSDRAVPEVACGLRRQFEQARGGTLFIDDIASIGPRVRDALLSLLDHASHTGAGTDAARRPARIIAGASRLLTSECASDPEFARLYYRLNILTINLIDDGQTGSR